jgi:tRNA (adenine57-N1/adenine58-N1)-methyltransferase catalytic subunit
VVTVQQRNVEHDGFAPELDGTADAAFLDLPEPWLAVPAAARCLRFDGVLCSFSPCIEQVQRVCEALEKGGFAVTRT